MPPPHPPPRLAPLLPHPQFQLLHPSPPQPQPPPPPPPPPSTTLHPIPTSILPFSSYPNNSLLPKQKSNNKQQRLLPLAPAPLPISSSQNDSISSSQTSSLDADRRRKAELRRARNRESAQRSNHRRKLKLQALKQAILHAEQDADRLRKREKALRARNVQLKAYVGR